jgi:predicted RNase H-like HicB family nuclease
VRYAVVIEEATGSFGAWVPDLPGCIAAGETEQEVLQLIEEAIALHIEGLRESGLEVPQPCTSVAFVEIAA